MGTRSDVFMRQKKKKKEVKKTERCALVDDTRRMAPLAAMRINEDY